MKRAQKPISGTRSNASDRIVIMPPGRVVFVELKSEGKTSTDQPKKRQAELRALGCTVYADIDTKEKVKEVLDRELRAARVPEVLHQQDP